eukprot:CAMPEP_0202687058 /NCGR_PEP_ID=MMETSP1385-20130828/2758_1 /ASSEMBLY_ACC=CAM_ASM_000861 /TAXON_ID=933848 /ORGANISM="Elphidium margaritaceum" /LENGTH=264 /DNA_ID=CAMNT_0049341771 /DNA_START=93 /DNA_END=887 /DNA_ORIENTATION=+
MAEEKAQDLSNREKVLLLFDVDGTLTVPRLVIKPSMWELLKSAKPQVYLGLVGGSDFPKQQEQLGGAEAGDVRNFFDFVFSENGLCAWENGKALNSHNLKKELSEDEIAQFVDFCMVYIAGLKLPKKRGTFVEFRSGMINVSPIGRNCSQEERIEYFEFDQKHKVREKMIEAFKQQLPELAKKLKCSIGGQISYDVFPHGWDKTYCLRFVEEKQFKEIHFFGDKTFEGGNDFEIFHDKRTIGHTVKSPEETEELIKGILAKLKK